MSRSNPLFPSWLSVTRKKHVRAFMTDMSAYYDRPDHVTYHAIEIFDKIIVVCDEPKDLKLFLKLMSLVCFLMACKMDGKYPHYSDVTRCYDVTHKDLVTFELWILTTLDWKISPCYSFMDIHSRIPEHLLPLYSKLISKSYDMDQLKNYSTDVIKEALLSLLSEGHPCFLFDIRKEVNLLDKYLCELDIQNCTDQTLCSAFYPVSVCDHVHKKQKK